MKRIILFICLLSMIVIAGCSANSVKEQPEMPPDTGDKEAEYFTGEIITDGNYMVISGRSLNSITFIPDKESLEIIKPQYGEKRSYDLIYDSLEKVEGLPDKLGIYKVKVKVGKTDDYGYLYIDDIMLTDNIGTVLYEGKAFDGNDLDDTVDIKDTIGGLIVNHVVKDDDGGIVVGFAGEIESEGYYFIDPNEDSMYGPTGFLYADKEYMNNFPTIYGERTLSFVWFSKTNEMFDELAEHSLFGRGKFKTSGYFLIYNYGMGYGPAGVLTEIISLDEDYTDLFADEGRQYIGNAGISDNFIIVNRSLYDTDDLESNYPSEREYYYINKKNPEKIKIPVDYKYYYSLSEVINDSEFILRTEDNEGNINSKSERTPHEIKCTVTPEGILTERME